MSEIHIDSIKLRDHLFETGVTVLLCGIAVTLLGSFVNAPILLLANFIATPIELR
jgi:hypothetical protein